MKHTAKRLLSMALILALALSLLPGFVLAEGEETLLAEGVATFESYDDACNGKTLEFTAEATGTASISFTACTPGFNAEIYEDSVLVQLYSGSADCTEAFTVTAGKQYMVFLCSYDVIQDDMAAGSVSYRITFVPSDDPSGGDGEPDDPSLIPGATPENPKPLLGEWDYIGAGKTVWYLFDNYQNMVDNGVYLMVLHISSSADYSVTYAGEDVPVDENGFVNFEMQDTEQQGMYLFSITNHSAEQKFFGISVKERPIYFDSGLSLQKGSNRNLQLSTDYLYTLYQFSPDETGIYQFRVTQGQVGDFGSPYNPTDNTPSKTNILYWTCTDLGQSVMIGFKGPQVTSCTVLRTGDYIPPEETPWTFYENTYDFTYQLPADVQTVDVDLTDGQQHTPVLDQAGFYHYGSAEGPLMVTDLNSIEINISEAHLNGGLRAWLQDEQGKTISKIDYNDAMFEYLEAGLVPVTQELATMLQEIGTANGWWVTGGLIFEETAPEDLSNPWMQLCSYILEVRGATISGSISAAGEGDTTVELIADQVTIASVTASEAYSFEDIEAGSYILRVSKQNHVTREYSVTVEQADMVQNVKLHLIGDIDGSGYINMGDISIMYDHIKGTKLLADEYQLLVANVNGGILNMGDFSALYAHIKGTKKLY